MFAIAIKAALLLAASWIGAGLLRRSSAAARHQIWMLGVGGALLLPVVSWVVPSLVPRATLTTATSLELPAVFVSANAAAIAPAWPLWLAIAWVVGSAVVLARVTRGHLAARRLVRSATPTFVERGVQILRSAQIASPMTVGSWRPCILVPAAADTWSRDRMHAVLVHELGHVRRRDLLVQLVAQLACALYWWNPLMWLAAARLRSEREHACDDLVLAAGIRPSSYATDILEVARSISPHPHTGVICMVDHASTEARLRRILDAKTPRRSPRARFFFATCALAGASVVMLACTSSRPTPVAPVPRGTLSIGAPFIREPAILRQPTMFRAPSTGPQIDLSLIASEVQRRIGVVEQCYQRRLTTNPALAGTVEIHWVIEESGHVADACITKDTVGDRELVDCVNALVLETGAFPAPRGGSVDVSVPFVFAAGS